MASGDEASRPRSPAEGERKDSFLRHLSATLRPLSDARAVQRAAAGLLGRHLGASRVHYAEIDGDTAVVRDEFVDGVGSVTGEHSVAAYGEEIEAALRAGRTVVFHDMSRDRRLPASAREALARTGAAAGVTTGLVKEGRLVALLTVHTAEPRRWTAAERVVVEESAERTWAAVERARAERERREMTARFRLVSENAPLIISIARADGTVEYVNPHWEAFSGRPAADFVSGAWLEAIHPDDRDRVLADWEAARTGGVSYTYEFRALDREGRYRWLRAHGVPIPASEGQPVEQWVSVAADIHDRHVAEQRARDASAADRRELALSELRGDVLRALEISTGLLDAAERLVRPLVPAVGEFATVERRVAGAGSDVLAVAGDAQLQRALLPAATVRDPRLTLAARYLAGSDIAEVGGDWFDSFRVRGDRVTVGVGDVVGHGPVAAAVMGRLRAAAEALSVDAGDPGDLFDRLDVFAADAIPRMAATACYATVDPVTRQLVYATAGHPPPLLVDREGATTWLDAGRSGPLGHHHGGRRGTGTTAMRPGDTVVLYSDGLVERRGELISTGLARLRRAAAAVHASPVEEVCDALLDELGVRRRRDDDVVVLCLRSPPAVVARFATTVPATPAQLSPLRAAVARWWREESVPGDLQVAQLAVGEACSNVVEHAYRGGDGTLDLVIEQDDTGDLVVTVRDHGSWRTPRSPGFRGWGTSIMRRLATHVDRRTSDAGTVVTLKLSSRRSLT